VDRRKLAFFEAKINQWLAPALEIERQRLREDSPADEFGDAISVAARDERSIEGETA